MYKIIVINGSGGVGKSTFVSLCKQINPLVLETSTVDFVKSIARCCGWDGTKSENNRKFLSDLKDLLEEYNDTPNKEVCKFIDEWKDNIIFVNAREPKNIEYYKNKYNAITLLIENNRVKKINTNHADANINNYEYDYIIFNNNDLETFLNQAEQFMKNVVDKM